MKLLLDTHVLIWWLYDDPRLAKHHRDLIMETDNTIFVSAASFWEIEIKRARGNLIIDPAYPEAIEEEGFAALPIDPRHTLALHRLPDHHQDPFDRILIAQSVVEELTLLSIDRKIARYGDCIKLL
ncbi:type II toxin-antitoxin system VapC family toxin [Hydrogenimonas sp.]